MAHTSTSAIESYDVVIVGAGASGIGTGITDRSSGFAVSQTQTAADSLPSR